jgi:hypothetical protein
MLLVAACATALQAQQTKVIPQGMDFVEGPEVSTVPFSATTSGIQLLIEASQITQSVGVLNGIRFRPTQSTQSSAGFTKNYQILAYTVPTTAAAFEASAFDLGCGADDAHAELVRGNHVDRRRDPVCAQHRFELHDGGGH